MKCSFCNSLKVMSVSFVIGETVDVKHFCKQHLKNNPNKIEGGFHIFSEKDRKIKPYKEKKRENNFLFDKENQKTDGSFLDGLFKAVFGSKDGDFNASDFFLQEEEMKDGGTMGKFSFVVNPNGDQNGEDIISQLNRKLDRRLEKIKERTSDCFISEIAKGEYIDNSEEKLIDYNKIEDINILHRKMIDFAEKEKYLEAGKIRDIIKKKRKERANKEIDPDVKGDSNM